jgi:hypothetical protein
MQLTPNNQEDMYDSTATPEACKPQFVTPCRIQLGFPKNWTGKIAQIHRSSPKLQVFDRFMRQLYANSSHPGMAEGAWD